MKHQVLSLCLLMSVYAGYSQTTLSFRPDSCNGKDATVFVKTNLPQWSEKNFGHRDEISASGWTYGGQGGQDGYSRSFIDFVDLKKIPRGMAIYSATLYLYGKTSSIFIEQGNVSPNACFIDRVTSPWEENTVNWNNKPSISFANESIIRDSKTATWRYDVAVDVTDMVQDMINLPADSSYGFCIRLQQEAYYRNLLFASSEYAEEALRPQLKLVFPSCGPSPFTVTIPDTPEVIHPNNEMKMMETAPAGMGAGTKGAIYAAPMETVKEQPVQADKKAAPKPVKVKQQKTN
ncbi:DNRLRE domain-containing protein [Chitinophaga pinensis]|uniref:Carbohydrate-binding module family 96 domain-containing protein n=1 Tax=Chitinophaga pinensis (strain ATCC 43595 / DSM 2588 / LMG 13176 / NBRC 15968 / NCIMB 11800 / UQM 2034) TaxID=485918 RepID=A0A979G897_CHIPD|nr:DNRLRE domain-containing protein [Chitinophaga pinensis]ACU62517.1 hypothetical protein Cpin_5085 [Chitinophaga pinensis DSM 2588]